MTQYTEFEFPRATPKPPCPVLKNADHASTQHVKQESYEAWKEQRVKALLAENNLEPEEWKPSVLWVQAHAVE